jgi:PAS domain S-box-containing protein
MPRSLVREPALPRQLGHHLRTGLGRTTACILVGGALILTLWIVVITSTRSTREAAIDHARAETHDLAITFADEVNRNLDEVADAMDVISRRLQAGEDPHDISAWALKMPIPSLSTIQVAIVDHNGRLISTTLDAHAKAIDLSDREHIRVHLDGHTSGIFISKPVIGRISGKVTLNITRRVVEPNGKLKYILVFSLSPERLTGLTAGLELGQDGTLALVGADGVVRARFTRDAPDGLSGIGQTLAGRQITALLKSGEIKAFFGGVSSLDGVERLVSFRRVGDFPLAVVAALSVREILAAPLAQQRRLVEITAVATLLVIGLSAYLIWDLHQRATERRKLEDTHHRLEADIAERERIERQLREAQDTLQDAVDSISEAFVIFDRDDRLVLWNEPYQRLYGAAAASILQPGRRFSDILRDAAAIGVYPDAVGREAEWVDERLAVRAQPASIVEQRLSDGRFLMITERRMRNGGTAGLRIDVTPLKTIELQLRELTNSLDQVQRIAGLGSMEVDIAVERIAWSAGACQIFGVTAAEVEPSFDYLRSFIHRDDLDAVNDAAAKANASGIAAPALEYRIIRPDGSQRVVYRENAIKYDHSGRAVSRILTFKDITELNAKENLLRRAIEHLDRVQRIAGIGHTTMDLTTGRFEWSAGACALFGIDPGAVEPSVEYFRQFVHPDDRKKVREAAAGALAGEAPPPLEYRIVRPDGAVRTVYRENAIEYDASGHRVRRIATFKDITELKAAEAQLRETMDHLERAQRLAHMGSDSRDLTTDHMEWSDESYRIFGLNRDEVNPTTENFLARVLPEDRPIVLVSREQVAAGICPAPFEYRIRRLDGEIRHIYRETDLIYDESGKAMRVVGASHDVTEQRAAEARLREMMDNLDRAQRLAHLGSYTRHLDGTGQWTAEVYRIFGVDPEAFEPDMDNFIAMVVPEDRDRVMAAHIQMGQGSCPEPFEYRIRRPSGEVRHIHRITELIRDERGSVVGTGGTLWDITELRAAEARQKELERQLLHSQKLEALGTLAGGVAHELNNALVPISALSKLMRQQLPADSADAESLEMIMEASDRARNLVASILSFSRKQDRLRKPVDLAELVRRSVHMLRVTLPATIRIEAKIGAVPSIMGDADALNQVVVNLVTNAAHAIGMAIGTIRVGLAPVRSVKTGAQTEGNAQVRLWVADTGCGMEAQTLERIFEPFFTTKEVGQGTGLGLSVVHGIVADHGGRIEVKSQLGKGTKFTIHLPSDAIATGISSDTLTTLAAA